MFMLLDVTIILAAAWDTHRDHRKARSWLLELSEFVICPITELGFLRVSMSPAYAASVSDATAFMNALRDRPGYRFIPDDQLPSMMPSVERYKDTTDAYLVTLAKAHDLKFATLDLSLLDKPWASGIALNPFKL